MLSVRGLTLTQQVHRLEVRRTRATKFPEMMDGVLLVDSAQEAEVLRQNSFIGIRNGVADPRLGNKDHPGQAPHTIEETRGVTGQGCTRWPNTENVADGSHLQWQWQYLRTLHVPEVRLEKFEVDSDLLLCWACRGKAQEGSSLEMEGRHLRHVLLFADWVQIAVVSCVSLAETRNWTHDGPHHRMKGRRL